MGDTPINDVGKKRLSEDSLASCTNVHNGPSEGIDYLFVEWVSIDGSVQFSEHTQTLYKIIPLTYLLLN
jgi:hypothetical protein